MPYADPEKQRAYQREWRTNRRAEWLAANGPCARCGSTEQLQVDHIDRATKIDHKVWTWSTERREAELAKCQVLCRSCHIEKGQETGDLSHGAPGMRNRHAVLSDDQIRMIRLRHANGESARHLSREYPVSYATIRRILIRKMWAHL